MSSSEHSDRSLHSKGTVENFLSEKASQRKVPAKWTDLEEHTFVLYLQQNAASAGDGVNFPKKIFNGAAHNLQEKFLEQTGGEKTGGTCHSKWNKVRMISYLDVMLDATHQILQLKEEYFAVVALKNASGFSWSDTEGAGKEKSDVEWKVYVKVGIGVTAPHKDGTDSSYNVDVQICSAFQKQGLPPLQYHGGDDAFEGQGCACFPSWQQTLWAGVCPQNECASPHDPK